MQQGLARALESDLRLPTLGEIARDLGKADQIAVIAVDGVDDDERPHACAVLADTPPFGLELALARRRLQRALRNAGLPVGLLIEVLEAAAHDLRGPVALDPLRARVP